MLRASDPQSISPPKCAKRSKQGIQFSVTGIGTPTLVAKIWWRIDYKQSDSLSIFGRYVNNSRLTYLLLMDRLYSARTIPGAG